MIQRNICYLILLSLLFLAQSPVVSPDQEATFDRWKKWLDEDVVYILTPEERDVFGKLTTDEERELFVEQFWRRRDTDPMTGMNEFQLEHYRRIHYANERYNAGIPGWKTDRGRVYIMYGEPHRIEAHPTGGPYARPEWEGGGHTSTFPFEIWWYRYVEGLGSDIEIEFVDMSGGGLYKMTFDPWEKDEFIRTGMGNTIAEDMAEDAGDDERYAALRGARITGFRKYGTRESQGVTMERAKYSHFSRVELVANLTRPPVINFTDLRAVVAAEVSYNTIPFRAKNHYLRMTDKYVLTPLALEFSNATVRFEQQYGIYVSKLKIYGLVTDLVGRLVYEFDDEIVNQYNEQAFALEKDGTSRYYRALALEPGRYKVQLVVKDEIGDQMGSMEIGLLPPKWDPTKLSSSSVVFTSKLSGAPPERALRNPYVFGRFQVKPRFDSNIPNDEYLGVYFEVYNFVVDPSTEEPSVRVEYGVRPRDQKTEPKFLNITRGTSLEPDHLSVPVYIDISQRPAGNYEVIFKIRDNISGEQLRLSERFRIQPGKKSQN